ncbi:MAG: cache domain-containing protein, partial [Campylobacterota bacterium]|nr:cache domain-containing protein [Campylobacterota bacterium]
MTVLLPSFSILVLSVILTYAIISYQNFFLEKEFEEDKNSYIKNQKSIIQNEVSKIFDLIDFKNKVIQIRLQKKVENEMKSFYSIVESVYLTYKDTKTKE